MDGEQIVQEEVLGSSMVPILSREIFAVLKWLRVRMPNVGVDLGLFANSSANRGWNTILGLGLSGLDFSCSAY